MIAGPRAAWPVWRKERRRGWCGCWGVWRPLSVPSPPLHSNLEFLMVAQVVH